MIDGLFGIIAPHYCYGCGLKGAILCKCCKNDILEDHTISLIANSYAHNSKAINLPSKKLQESLVWGGSPREGVLAEVIDAHKFKRAKSAYRPLAELLFESLPSLPKSIVVVPVPAAPKNVRIRGYDHMTLIAKELGRLGGWRVTSLLKRNSNVTQHFSKSATVRRSQAKNFFSIRQQPEARITYLVVDDILTTGATLDAAVDCLEQAGAKTVLTAVVARQILK